jgi:hypothetical protein
VAELKQRVLTGAGELDEPLVALSRRIHECPELSHREIQAVAACVAFHTREAAAWSGSDRAQAAMLTGARAMALTAVDLLTEPAALARVRAAHGPPGAAR